MNVYYTYTIYSRVKILLLTIGYPQCDYSY